MKATHRVICICSGNICRSPMAVALLREELAVREIPAVVISAGTLGIQGRRAADFARQVISEKGSRWSRHIEEHRSQGISSGLLQLAEHLIIMDRSHYAYLEQEAPSLLSRVVPIWEFSGVTPPLNGIADPIGKDAEAFRSCRDLLEEALIRWVDQTFGTAKNH